MSTADTVIDRLYTNYLLRDFVAKLLPGAVFLGTVLLTPYDTWLKVHALDDLPAWTWLLFLGASLVTGFAIQAFGEMTGLARIYPRNGSRNYTRQQAIYRMVALHSREKPWANLQRERYVAIKEMSATTALALLLSIAYVAVAYYAPGSVAAIQFFIALAISATLFWYQGLLATAQREYEEQVLVDTAPPPPSPTKLKPGA